MKIAALLDDDGRAASPETGGTVYVFERSGDEWAASLRLPFAAGEATTMSGLRGQLEEVSQWLGDCRVLAARSAVGYYRVALATLGVALWAVRGQPEEFIEQIERYYRRAAELVAAEQPPEPSASIEPVPERVGHYRVDLRGVMGTGGHSSRRVLLPFLREASFTRLEITCDHTPRWFATELADLDLAATEQSVGEFLKVHVYPIGTGQRDTARHRRRLELRPVGVAAAPGGSDGCGGGGCGGSRP